MFKIKAKSKMISYGWIVTFMSVFSLLYSQPNTTKIIAEVKGLKEASQHIKFWKEIFYNDQNFRGKDTNDSLDVCNLLKCAVYFNQFGLPDTSLGRASQIYDIVWIHNRYPQADLICFPLVYAEFKKGLVEEKHFREYYLRSVYSKQFCDKGYLDLDVSLWPSIHGINLTDSIPIDALVVSLEKEMHFIKQRHHLVGLWHTYQLVGEDGKIESKSRSEKLRIFRTENEEFYLQYLYEDGSYYPRLLHSDKTQKDHFTICENSDWTLRIAEDGKLHFKKGNDYRVYAK